MHFIVSCHERRDAFKHIHSFSFYILLLCRENRRFHGFFCLSLYATMQHGLYLVRRYLSDTTSGQLLACRDNVRSGKSIFSGIVQQQNKRPVVLLEMDVIQPSQFFRCSLPNHRVGQCPRFTGKCTQIVLQLDAPVSTAITALMRGHFLLPVQDDDFFTKNNRFFVIGW